MPKKLNAGKSGKEVPKRLSPTPDTLRELYMLSGNRCAMPGCNHVLIDGDGVVVSHICHIRAAMPDGARFDPDMTNEARRHMSNLVMMCGGHHTQIDSKVNEAKWTLKRVTKVKRDHEAKFKGIGASLLKAFESEYSDVTDALEPTEPTSFKRFEKLMKDRLDAEQAVERCEEIASHLERMRLVPDAERSFILAVVNRGLKLGYDPIVVPAADLKSAVSGMSHTKLQHMRNALEQYGVGDLDEATVAGNEVPCVWIKDPSSYVSWVSLSRFCDLSGASLEDFIIYLNFGLLDG